MVYFGRAAAAAALVAFAAPAQALVLADFEGGSLGGGTVGGGDLVIATIGSGACAGMVAGGGATGSALCGNETTGSDAADPAVDTFTLNAVDLSRPTRITFALAANAIDGDLDPGDFFQIEVAGAIVATFNGTGVAPTAGRMVLSSSASGFSGPAFYENTFTQYAFRTAGGDSATSTVTFSFSNSSGSEFLGLDQVEVEVVPVPAALGLMLAGLAALGIAGRRRAA